MEFIFTPSNPHQNDDEGIFFKLSKTRKGNHSVSDVLEVRKWADAGKSRVGAADPLWSAVGRGGEQAATSPGVGKGASRWPGPAGAGSSLAPPWEGHAQPQSRGSNPPTPGPCPLPGTAWMVGVRSPRRVWGARTARHLRVATGPPRLRSPGLAARLTCAEKIRQAVLQRCGTPRGEERPAWQQWRVGGLRLAARPNSTCHHAGGLQKVVSYISLHRRVLNSAQRV